MSFPQKRDDLHLSRIMLQQDLYSQHRHNEDGKMNIQFLNFHRSFLVQINSNEQMMATSDTMKDANDTLSKSLIFIFCFSIKRIVEILDTQGKFQSPESDFRKVDTSSSVSTVNEPPPSVYRKTIKIKHLIFFVFFHM
jgi:hypothetical protein